MLVQIGGSLLVDPKLVEAVSQDNHHAYRNVALSNGATYRVTKTAAELLRIINEGLIASEWLE